MPQRAIATGRSFSSRQCDCKYTGVLRWVQLAIVVLSIRGVNGETARPEREPHPYRQHWRRSTFGKVALAGVGVKAGFGQLLGHPTNYGGGLAGFGKRIGAGFATHAVKTTVEHVVAAPLHEDLIYHRSDKTGFSPRLLYALKSSVVTHSTRSGKAHPAVGRLSGHAAAGVVSQVALHASSGAATAGFGLTAEAGINVAREFWPRHNSEDR